MAKAFWELLLIYFSCWFVRLFILSGAPGMIVYMVENLKVMILSLPLSSMLWIGRFQGGKTIVLSLMCCTSASSLLQQTGTFSDPVPLPENFVIWDALLGLMSYGPVVCFAVRYCRMLKVMLLGIFSNLLDGRFGQPELTRLGDDDSILSPGWPFCNPGRCTPGSLDCYCCLWMAIQFLAIGKI